MMADKVLEEGADTIHDGCVGLIERNERVELVAWGGLKCMKDRTMMAPDSRF